MKLSRAAAADMATRRAGLIRLRREGVRYDDPRITGPESPTCLGYSSAQHASKDLIRALEEARDNEKAEASVYRQQENERLDDLLAAVWDKATNPSPVYDREGNEVTQEIDLKAVDTVLKLMDRRAKLNGLDMPQRTELSGPDGGAVPLGSGSLDELNTLIGYAGQPNTPTADNSDQEDAGGDTDG